MSKESAALPVVRAVIVATVFAGLIAAASDPAQAGSRRSHPAMGSWFGKAVQLTPDGSPGLALFMTPSLYADGNFVGNDTFSLAGPPFGPHTTAHGTWTATGAKSFSADYVFMLPSADGFAAGARFQWVGEATSRDRLVGYVNIAINPQIPLRWEDLGENEFPELPAAGRELVRVPEMFYTDPAEAAADNVLVFKFTIRRVRAGG